MELSEKDIEQLHLLWENLLPDAEKAQLLRRLAQDSEFAKAANDHKTISDGLEAYRNLRVRKMVREMDDAMGPVKAPVFSRRLKGLFGLVFIFALMVAALYWMLFWDKQQDAIPCNEEIVAAAFEAPKLTRLPLSSQQEPRVAIDAYTKGDYKSAISFWEQYVYERRDTLRLYSLGVAYLATNQGQKAIPIFRELQGKNMSEQEDAEWFLALALLQTGEVAATKQQIDTIIKNQGRYAKAAEQLLKAIDDCQNKKNKPG